ncbi:MAG: hypothetical protein H0W50_06220 [Parachlamydiaceae bacterium]|nr:hypothetical protein [Parachlamydiaceae bacterium]
MIEFLKWGSQVVHAVDGAVTVAVEIGNIHNDLYGDDAKEKLTKEEKIDLGFRVASVAFKSMNIGIDATKITLGNKCPSSLKNFQVLTNIAPDILHIAKPFVKGDAISLGKTSWGLLVCFAKAYKHTEANMCSTSHKTNTVVCDIFTCVSGGVRFFKYTHPKEFNKACAVTYAKIFALTAAIKRLWNKFFVVVTVAKKKQELEKNIEEISESIDIQFENLMLFLDGLTLKKIPPCLPEDEFFMSIRCKITGEPIRYVVQPKQNDGDKDLGDILYERTEIELYLKKAEIPPCWPKGLKFAHANIEANHDIQFKINEHLIKLREEAKQAKADYEEFQKSISKQ